MGVIELLLGDFGVAEMLLAGGEERAVKQVKQWIAGMARANELGLIANSRKGLKISSKRIAQHVIKHSVPTDDELRAMLSK